MAWLWQKNGNRNTGGTGEAGPNDRNGSTGVTSSRSGVSALMATTEAFSAVWLPVLVGTVAATPGRPLKQEWRFKLLMAAIDDGGGGICSKSNN